MKVKKKKKKKGNTMICRLQTVAKINNFRIDKQEK